VRCDLAWSVSSPLSSGSRACFFFSSRRRHTRCYRDWSSDVCSSDLYHTALQPMLAELRVARMLARLLYEHPRARRWVFGRVGQRLVEAITDVFMGARTYRESVVGFVAALALRPSTRSYTASS